MKWLSVIIIAIAFASSIQNDEVKKIQVSVYYETLCGDSVAFLRDQLYPTWQKRRDEMDIKLVPYGKAAHYWDTREDKWVIFCQHGPRECQLNELHACALAELEFAEAFEFVHCMITGSRQANISTCMTNEDKKNAIKNCTETQKGIDLIIGHGNQTQTHINPLYFVPSIEIDNEFDQDAQDDLLYHFSRDFCKRYRAKYHKKLSNC